MDKYPLMDLVLTLCDPHFQSEADRLLVIFHFLLIQNGFRVVDDVRQVTHETLYLAKDDQNSINIVYKKKGEWIHALHEIAAGRKISDDLPIIDGTQALGEFIIDNYLIEETPTYSSKSGVTDPPSIVIMNLDNFIHRALEVIRKLDEFIDEKQGVHSIDPTDGASAEHP